MTDTTQKSDAARLEWMAGTVAGVARQAGFEAPDGGRLYLVPEGFSLDRVPPLEPALPRVNQAVTLDTVESFVAYVKRYVLDDQTVLFADQEERCVEAVFDYHHASEYVDGDSVVDSHLPGRQRHRAVFPAPFSEEWRRWTAIDRKALPQREFLEHIEENAADVAKPEAAALLDLVANFRAHRSVRYERGVQLADGTVQLTYHEDQRSDGGRGNVTVPSEIELAVPVFLGDRRVAVKVWLRHRIGDDGGLSFTAVIHRRELIEQHLFGELVETIGNETEVPLWFGRRG